MSKEKETYTCSYCFSFTHQESECVQKQWWIKNAKKADPEFKKWSLRAVVQELRQHEDQENWVEYGEGASSSVSAAAAVTSKSGTAVTSKSVTSKSGTAVTTKSAAAVTSKAGAAVTSKFAVVTSKSVAAVTKEENPNVESESEVEKGPSRYIEAANQIDRYLDEYPLADSEEAKEKLESDLKNVMKMFKVEITWAFKSITDKQTKILEELAQESAQVERVESVAAATSSNPPTKKKGRKNKKKRN